MTQYELDTLELAHSAGRDKTGVPFLRVAESEIETDAILRLLELKLVTLRSMTGAKGVTAFFLESTQKGHDAMFAEWNRKYGDIGFPVPI